MNFFWKQLRYKLRKTDIYPSEESYRLAAAFNLVYLDKKGTRWVGITAEGLNFVRASRNSSNIGKKPDFYETYSLERNRAVIQYSYRAINPFPFRGFTEYWTGFYTRCPELVVKQWPNPKQELIKGLFCLGILPYELVAEISNHEKIEWNREFQDRYEQLLK